jgi:hypothetical protein
MFFMRVRNEGIDIANKCELLDPVHSLEPECPLQPGQDGRRTSISGTAPFRGKRRRCVRRP